MLVLLIPCRNHSHFYIFTDSIALLLLHLIALICFGTENHQKSLKSFEQTIEICTDFFLVNSWCQCIVLLLMFLYSIDLLDLLFVLKPKKNISSCF